jgi:hypothetical protein
VEKLVCFVRQAFLTQRAGAILARRAAQSTEVVGAAVFLASNEACSLYGITLPIDGQYGR